MLVNSKSDINEKFWQLDRTLIGMCRVRTQHGELKGILVDHVREVVGRPMMLPMVIHGMVVVNLFIEMSKR